MAKRKSAPGYMTPGEQIGGTIFFLLYLLVLPVAAGPAFRLAERLLGTAIPAALENSLYYYILFAVTVVLFHRFLGRTTRNFADNLGPACRAMVLGLVAFYGLNELMFRLSGALLGGRTNLNDMAISAQIQDAPRSTFLLVVFLAPFVEEVLFRGLVFGCLKPKSRTVAYVVSCGLFAFLHVWQFAMVSQDVTYFVLMLQYLVPGAVLCWTYETSGTIWSPLAVHAAANALSLLVR